MASTVTHIEGASTQDSEPSSRLPLTVEQGQKTLSEIEREMHHYADMQECAIPRLCMCLEATLAWNDMRAPPSEIVLENFEGNFLPVSASDYVQHILKYSRCSTCSVVIGLLYLERLKKRHSKLRVTSTNIQRLLLVATMTAAKFCDDFLHGNGRWAKIGGMSLRELNALEVDFLFTIQFDLSVTTENYLAFTKKNLLMGTTVQNLEKSNTKSTTEGAKEVVEDVPSEKPSKGKERKDLAWLEEATTEKRLPQGAIRRESSAHSTLSMDDRGDSDECVIGEMMMPSKTTAGCGSQSELSIKKWSGARDPVMLPKSTTNNIFRRACAYLSGENLQASKPVPKWNAGRRASVSS